MKKIEYKFIQLPKIRGYKFLAGNSGHIERINMLEESFNKLGEE